MSQREVIELREEFAKLAHEQWSGWIKYMFGKCDLTKDGELTIPRWAVIRWRQQSQTEYKDLSDEERDSDRAEADKFLALLRAEPKPRRHVIEKKIEQSFNAATKIANTFIDELWPQDEEKAKTMHDILQAAFDLHNQALTELRTEPTCKTCGGTHKKPRPKGQQHCRLLLCADLDISSCWTCQHYIHQETCPDCKEPEHSKVCAIYRSPTDPAKVNDCDCKEFTQPTAGKPEGSETVGLRDFVEEYQSCEENHDCELVGLCRNWLDIIDRQAAELKDLHGDLDAECRVSQMLLCTNKKLKEQLDAK